MTTSKFLNKIFSLSTSNQDSEYLYYGNANYSPDFYIESLNPRDNPKKKQQLINKMNYCIACGYIELYQTQVGQRINITPYGLAYVNNWKTKLSGIVISISVGSITTCLGVLIAYFLP